MDGVRSLTGYLYANSTFKTLEYWAVALMRLPFFVHLYLLYKFLSECPVVILNRLSSERSEESQRSEESIKKMKKILKYISSAAFGLVVFLFWIILHPYDLSFQEQNQLFILTWD